MMDISSKSSFKFDKLKYQLYQNKYRSMIRDYQLPKNRDFKENNYSRNEGSMFKRNFRKPPNYNSYENERPQYSPENLTTLLIDCVKKKLSQNSTHPEIYSDLALQKHKGIIRQRAEKIINASIQRLFSQIKKSCLHENGNYQLVGEELSSDNNTIRDFLEEIQIPENNSKEKTYNQDPLALDISEIKMNFQKKMKDYEKLTIKNVDEPYDPEIKQYLVNLGTAQSELNLLCQKFSWSLKFEHSSSCCSKQKHSSKIEIFVSRHGEVINIIGNCTYANTIKQANHIASLQCLLIIFTKVPGAWKEKNNFFLGKILNDGANEKYLTKEPFHVCKQYLIRPFEKNDEIRMLLKDIQRESKDSRFLVSYLKKVDSYVHELKEFIQKHSKIFMAPQWTYLKVNDEWSLQCTVVSNKDGYLCPYKGSRKDKTVDTVKEIICLNIIHRIYQDFPELIKNFLVRGTAEF